MGIEIENTNAQGHKKNRLLGRRFGFIYLALLFTTFSES